MNLLVAAVMVTVMTMIERRVMMAFLLTGSVSFIVRTLNLQVFEQHGDYNLVLGVS
jgi:hypothetical protein